MSGPAVLVTRAQPGADETAHSLRELGYVAVVSPAIELLSCPDTPLPEPGGFAGLVFTSANGVRFLAERSPFRAITAWCVGPATAKAAMAAGFRDVRNAMGDAERLAACIAADAAPDDGPLLHVANSAAAGDLAGALRAAGFDVKFAALYRSAPATAFTPEALKALTSGDLDAVLFHSAKGAEAFSRLAVRAGIPLDKVEAVGVSQKALTPVAGLGWAGMTAADAPNETELLAALQRVLTPA